MKNNNIMKKIISLAKLRGFIHHSSEIYGGIANIWDYGYLGVELKNNIKKIWWKNFITQIKNNIGVDCSILTNSNVWIASGHVKNFTDTLIDCKKCHKRFCADKIIKNFCYRNDIIILNKQINSINKMEKIIKKYNITCPNCNNNNFTNIRYFNLMFNISQKIIDEQNKNILYLRPETAQNIFINFKNIYRTSRKKLPFGVGQIGKSFRNEITPGNFIFRTREFEQMELEFFCRSTESLKWFYYWKYFCFKWLLYILGIKNNNIRYYDHKIDELSFYSKKTTDIEFLFPFGWGELCGISNRTNYDLIQHQKKSKIDMSYFDDKINKKYIPYVIETSIGIDRIFLSLLCNSYHEENVNNNKRIILRLNKFLAPIKICIMPLSKKINKNAIKIYERLSMLYNCEYDENGNIGKRYRRQDEIGTPFCITYDFLSEKDKSVTIRNRDTMYQNRIKISNLLKYFKNIYK